MVDLATIPDNRKRRGNDWGTGLSPAIERARATREPKPQKPAAVSKPAPVIVEAAAPPSIEITGRALAKIFDYDGLWNAVRGRYAELGITRIGADALSKLPDGYCGKLLGAAQVRKIGLNSLERILEGTGCFLVLVEDPGASAKMMATAKELGLLRRIPARQLKLLPPPRPPAIEADKP
jgi:hypothetical protein